MDPLTARAVADYHQLLREREASSQELEDHFVERMQAARLTFGGRVLCPFLRPNFVSPAAYEQIRGVCRGIFRAIEKVEARLGAELWDRVDVTPEERELVRDRPRLRAQLAHLAARLVHHHQRLPVRGAERGEPGRHRLQRGAGRRLPGAADRAAFQEQWTLRRFQARERAAGDAASTATARRGGRERAPDHRHRGLRGRAHPHRAPPVPRVLRASAAIRRSCAIRATSPTRTARCATRAARSTSSTSGCS